MPELNFIFIFEYSHNSCQHWNWLIHKSIKLFDTADWDCRPQEEFPYPIDFIRRRLARVIDDVMPVDMIETRVFTLLRVNPSILALLVVLLTWSNFLRFLRLIQIIFLHLIWQFFIGFHPHPKYVCYPTVRIELNQWKLPLASNFFASLIKIDSFPIYFGP